MRMKLLGEHWLRIIIIRLWRRMGVALVLIVEVEGMLITN
jgi:hypothetical protein